MSALRDGHDVYGQDFKHFLARPKWIIVARSHGVPRPSLTFTAPDAPPLEAQINNGRWIARCECNCHMAVYLDAPWMWCSGCANAALGGALRPVIFPSAEKRERIARVLLARPDVRNLNWRPGELIGRLRNENLAHGAPREVMSDGSWSDE